MSDDFDVLLQDAYRYACALTHNDTVAEDIVQDACVSIIKAGGSWDRPYLFSAVRARFIDSYRRQRRAGARLTLNPNGAVKGISSPPAGCEIERRDRLRSLDNALAKLRPTEREALFLTEVQGYTAQQVADQTQRSRGTVLSLLKRSRQKLRELLSPSECEVG